MALFVSFPGELSTCDESGWREVSQTRVDKMVAKIKNGEFGQTQIADPTVLVGKNGTAKVSTITGEYLLDNGKNVIEAVRQIEKELEEDPEAGHKLSEMEESDWPEWMDKQLRDILIDGWQLEQVQYDDDDATIRIAVQVIMGPPSRVA